MSAYLLVGTPRTGSSRLAEALSNTGLLGRPEGEYFWRWQEKSWADVWGLPVPAPDNYEAYVATARLKATTANGVFAGKLFWEHLKDLLTHAAGFAGMASLSAEERFVGIFGPVKAVLLTRNCLDAALSLWRAEVTNIWSVAADDPPPPPPDRLDVWRVTVLHTEYHAAEIGWRHFLRSVDVPYMEMSYEEVSRDLGAAVLRVAEFVGVELRKGPTQPSMRKQADGASARFRREWSDKTGGCGLCELG